MSDRSNLRKNLFGLMVQGLQPIMVGAAFSVTAKAGHILVAKISKYHPETRIRDSLEPQVLPTPLHPAARHHLLTVLQPL